MAQGPTLYTGTIGQSVWRSEDGGDSWRKTSTGMPSESDIRAIAVNPEDASILFAGTEAGICRSKDGGDSWERLDSPMNELQIWAIAISPRSPNRVYAGTCPSALFRSDDGGESWKQLEVELAAKLKGTSLIPRVTTILIDPEDDETVYVGIEVDGMRISRDGGETWTAGNEGLSSLDIHGLGVVPGDPKTLVAGTNNDVCITTDMVNWTPLGVREHFPWPYCRGMLHLSSDSGRVYVGAGIGPTWDEGCLFCTPDLGRSWERADLGGNTNSTVWALAHNAAVRDWIMAYSIFGQLFRSTDNGNSWEKLAREFGEVRAVAVAP